MGCETLPLVKPVESELLFFYNRFEFSCKCLPYLRVNNNPDYGTVFLHLFKVFVQLFLSRLILPLLAVLNKGLLLALVPEAQKSSI